MFHARKAPGGRATARSARRFLGGALLLALLTTIAVSTGVIEGINTIADAFDRGQLITSADLTPATAGAPQTIMIVGSDKRAGSKDQQDRSDPPHTDTILLVRLDPKAGDVSVLSVPRDLLVPRFSFQGSTYLNQKINYAYTVGSEYGHSPTAGDKLALAVVKKALGGIQINEFVDLNFNTFEQVVTKLGCVYVDVDHVFFHRNYAGEPSDQNYQAINIRPGYKALCGNTALAYVRYRHDDNTFARDARQQDFLRQAKDQLGVTGLLEPPYQDFLSALGKSITRNIHSGVAVGGSCELLLYSLRGPVRQVQFPDDAVQVETINGLQDDQTATQSADRARRHPVREPSPAAAEATARDERERARAGTRRTAPRTARAALPTGVRRASPRRRPRCARWRSSWRRSCRSRSSSRVLSSDWAAQSSAQSRTTTTPTSCATSGTTSTGPTTSPGRTPDGSAPTTESRDGLDRPAAVRNADTATRRPAYPVGRQRRPHPGHRLDPAAGPLLGQQHALRRPLQRARWSPIAESAGAGQPDRRDPARLPR